MDAPAIVSLAKLSSFLPWLLLAGYCTDPPHFRTDLNAPRPSYNVNYGDRLEISCQLECGDLVYISKFLRKANGGLNVSNLDRTNIHRLEFDEQRQQTKELYRRTWVLESVTDQHNGEWSCQGGDLDRPVEQRFHIHVKGNAMSVHNVLWSTWHCNGFQDIPIVSCCSLPWITQNSLYSE